VRGCSFAKTDAIVRPVQQVSRIKLKPEVQAQACVRILRVSAMQPAPPDHTAQQLWDRVVTVAGVGAENDDEFRQALLLRVVPELARRLAGSPGIDALAAEVDADDDDDCWYGAGVRARQFGGTMATRLVVWLVATKTTSGEADSPYFHAMGAAAASLVGGTMPPLGARADALYAEHGQVLARFVDAQRDLTRAFLAGLRDVPLHRGDVLPGPLPDGPINPSLWPLASFAVDFDTAASFAVRKAGRLGGIPVVYSANISVERIAATPETGCATGAEREVVVLVGDAEDRATVTAP
jgi:hypothetical protein